MCCCYNIHITADSSARTNGEKIEKNSKGLEENDIIPREGIRVVVYSSDVDAVMRLAFNGL